MLDSGSHITEAFIENNQRAFDQVYDAYAANLYGFLLQMLKDEAEAQDVLQESFIKIWKNAHSFDASKSKLFTWMLNICRNAAIDRIRKNKTRTEKEIQSADSYVYKRKEVPKPEHLDMQKHIDQLEDKYAIVIRLLFFEGFTQQEASDQLDIPLGTVKTRLKIGLRELKKLYTFRQNEIGLLFLLVWMTG